MLVYIIIIIIIIIISLISGNSAHIELKQKLHGVINYKEKPNRFTNANRMKQLSYSKNNN